jgi:hypothetical protein
MKRAIPFLILTTFLSAACGVMRSAAPMVAEAPAMPEMNHLEAPGMGGAPAEPDMYAPVPMPTAGSYQDVTGQSGGANVAPSLVERMVIQNADIAIVVSDVETRLTEISDLAKDLGGYVLSSNLYQSYTSQSIEVPEAQVVIKVPFEKLDEALELIKKDALEVQSENRSGEDVTAQYVDLKSRLKNLEAAETQLEEIMKQASETEDVVNVFNQLVYYREQIELVKGQMNYYEQAAALSTVTVRLIAEETIQPLKVAGWEPRGVAREAVQNLIYFYQDFVDFVIYFTLNTLPKLITIGIPLYLIFVGARAVFRRLRGSKPAPPQPVQPIEEDRKKKK